MNGAACLNLLKLAAPEAILALAAVAVLFVDGAIMRGQPLRHRFLIGSAVAGVACLGAFLWMLHVPVRAAVSGGMFVADPLTQTAKGVLLFLALLTAAVSLQSQFTRHVGEYFALLLLATVGMMCLVSAEDVLMIFVSLELTSLSLYVLAALDKSSPAGAEAAFKYFLFGGVSAAFMLFGLSLLYGLSGTTSLRGMAAKLQGQALDPALALGLVMALVGLGFKIAAVPFHLWAPDAYQGAPTPCAALIASGSKVASFFVLAKVLMVGFAQLEGSGAWRGFAPGWAPLLAAMAAASLLLGNLGALAQSNVKRLLAYSAIAHSGYMLVGLLAGSVPAHRPAAMAAVVFYAATYGLTAVGAFFVVAVVERETGGSGLEHYAGLSRRAPFLSLCMLVFLLSLAGIPPLAGFLGKFLLFAAATGAEPRQLGLLWLVVLAILMSAVSLYYYLQVLKRIYVVPAEAASAPVSWPLPERLALGLTVIAVVLLGCVPSLFLDPLQQAVSQAGLLPPGP